MNVDVHYAMRIQWSDLDHVSIVTLPDWSGRVSEPVTHRASYEEAAQCGREVLELRVEDALANGEELPRPSLLASVA